MSDAKEVPPEVPCRDTDPIIVMDDGKPSSSSPNVKPTAFTIDLGNGDDDSNKKMALKAGVFIS